MAKQTTYRNLSTGASATGELIIESSNAYQVAVAGKVTLLPKKEWHEGPAVGDLFDSFFGGFAGTAK